MHRLMYPAIKTNISFSQLMDIAHIMVALLLRLENPVTLQLAR